MLRSNSKSLGNHVVSPEEERKGCSGKDLQKRRFWNERVGDGKPIMNEHDCYQRK